MHLKCFQLVTFSFYTFFGKYKSFSSLSLTGTCFFNNFNFNVTSSLVTGCELSLDSMVRVSLSWRRSALQPHSRTGADPPCVRTSLYHWNNRIDIIYWLLDINIYSQVYNELFNIWMIKVPTYNQLAWWSQRGVPE